jgi:hypothetical protein
MNGELGVEIMKEELKVVLIFFEKVKRPGPIGWIA